jgi:hypothetical protein
MDQTGVFLDQLATRLSIHHGGHPSGCKLYLLAKNKNEGEMITAYQRMVDRMTLSALGLKHHQLDNKCLSCPWE